MTLHGRQNIRFSILVRHEPRLSMTFSSPSYTQPLPLSDGVIHQAGMHPYGLAAGSLYLSSLARQIAVEKFPERALANKANSCAVFLGKIWQAVFPRNS